MNAFLRLLLSCTLLAGAAHAHPVAQGQLDIRWQPESLLISARVASEQIMVASALGGQATSAPDSVEAMWQEHGRYLLQHLQVWVDGRRLGGTVQRVTAGTDDFVTYQLAYALAAAPRELRLQQDLLNEIEYVPGNRWEATFLVRFALAAEPQRSYLLASHNRPLSLTGSAAGESFQQGFFLEGVRHILGGYDHLLFVSALVLGAFQLRSLIGVLAAFTLAHSLTLTLSVLNLVRLPASVIEPMIAASIVVVACGNLLRPRNASGSTRAGTAFFFGLFHGLGFAGGLLAATQDLSGRDIALAIGAFSAGVEAGHLLVIVPLFLALRVLRQTAALNRTPDRSTFVVMRGGSALVLVAGVAYLIRAAGL